MANPEHLALLKQGVVAWNEWRQANPGIRPDFSGAYLHRASLSGANLFEADLSRAILTEADLYKAILAKANLHKANLYKANLCEAILVGVILTEESLGEVNLSKANLFGADLSRAQLYRANLSGAYLYKTDLSEAILIEADLSGAILIKTDLSGANLCEAILSRAQLYRVNLSGAQLTRMNLDGSSLWNTVFADINLAEVEGLDTCDHIGPSTLDFRTLQRSGPLPLAFLRGCGLPDLPIDYLRSLLNQPIQFYSCFISYSSKDEDFTKRLHADLQDKGVRCWFAPKDIQGGYKIHEQIGEAIRLHEKLLLVLSEHSMNSEWVKTEIAEARQREVRGRRQVLFPISLVAYEKIKQWDYFDADIGKSSAREIREYFIPDFSNWKSHDDYQQAFDRLLRGLKPELERKPETP